MKVIVNGDDFGYSIGQNLGILECFQNGIMTSTSLMTNMPGFSHAIMLMKQHPELEVGLHFVMTVGKPLSNASQLVNEEGNFDRDLQRIERADIEEIRMEYTAQLDKFLASGFTPKHLDFHYGITEKQYQVIRELAVKLHVAVRAMDKDAEQKAAAMGLKYSKNFVQDFYDEGVTLDTLIHIFENNKEKEQIEMMCHPAYVDATILHNSRYTTQRALEMELLCSPEIKAYIKSHPDIELIAYQDL